MVGAEDSAVMSVLVLLIAAGGAVASGFLMAFVWAVRSGQFDDVWTPAVRVLLDARTTSTVERDESAAPIVSRQQP
jgi:cbb3-type cytochrome oxidase maturation protein